MRSILEEFAYGNISPETQNIKRDSEFAEAMKDVSSTEEKLFYMLNGEEKSAFQRYVDAQGKVNHCTAVNNLVYGYKLGLLMAAEAFMTSGELVAGGED